jgi:hypothetical protein
LLDDQRELPLKSDRERHCKSAEIGARKYSKINLRRECTFGVVDGFQVEVTETAREIASGFASNLNLSPFSNHGPLKISNDSLVLLDGLVDRCLSAVQDIWKGERMPEHRFPLPVFLG